MGNVPKGDKNEIDNKATATDSASDDTSEVDEATAPLDVLVRPISAVCFIYLHQNIQFLCPSFRIHRLFLGMAS